MTLRRQMMLLIAGPTLLIYVLILGFAAVSQYRQSKLEVERAMTRLASSYAARLDGYFREASRIAITSARFVESSPQISDETVYAMLENNVRQSPFVYGSCLAFEPGTRRTGDELFAPYVCRAGDGVRQMNIDRAVYDWYRDPQYTWFSEPKRLGRDVWSDPYFDKGAGTILMSTYSATFRAGDSFGGVCTVDIDLPRLRETVGRDIDEQLDFVILSKDGHFVFHPDPSRIMARTVFDYLGDSGRESLAPIFHNLLSGGVGAAWLDCGETDDDVGVFFAPVSSTNWMFVARVPADTVLRDVRRRRLVNAAALTSTLLLVSGCIYFVARRIAAPWQGKLVETGADGVPLGLMPDNQYGPANEFKLETGDSVVLITDGLFEWSNAEGEAYGLERLRESILALSQSPADDMIHGLFERARQFVGEVPQMDDVTIVVVRRT